MLSLPVSVILRSKTWAQIRRWASRSPAIVWGASRTVRTNQSSEEVEKSAVPPLLYSASSLGKAMSTVAYMAQSFRQKSWTSLSDHQFSLEAMMEDFVWLPQIVIPLPELDQFILAQAPSFEVFGSDRRLETELPNPQGTFTDFDPRLPLSLIEHQRRRCQSSPRG